MFCTKCGAVLEEGTKFCTRCGKPVEDVQDEMPATQRPTQQSQGAGSYSMPHVTSIPSGTQRQSAANQPPTAMPAFGGKAETGVQPKPRNNKTVIIVSALAVLAAVAVGAAIMVGLGVFEPGGDSKGKTTTESVTSSQEESSQAATTSTSSSVSTSTKTSSSTSSSTTSSSAGTASSQGGSSQNSALPASNPYSSYTADYIISDSNTRSISTSELSGYSKAQLKIARNEIFARHGREFRDADLDAYFRSKHWYTPSVGADDFDNNTSSYLSDLELKNAETIRSYEKSKGYL